VSRLVLGSVAGVEASYCIHQGVDKKKVRAKVRVNFRAKVRVKVRI
jgi:hypothetical protein